MLIAEIGNNHEGSLERAFRLIDLAAPHCDAVKFQIFRAETLVHPSLPARVGNGTQQDRLRSLEFTTEAWFRIKRHCEQQGVEFMATCFDVDLLKLWAPHLKRIKIASGDISYHPLIEAAAATGKPVIVSTGCALDEDLNTLTEIVPDERLTLLHCVSRYPCVRPHLGRMAVLRRRFAHVGYSCHTPGIEACYTAAVLGAEVIEKHFTDERRTYGDHVHSALPQELAELSRKLKDLTLMLDSEATPPDMTLRRGAYAARAIRQGESLDGSNLAWLRPERGSVPSVAGRDYAVMEPVCG